MGLFAQRWWRQDRPAGLATAQICIMWEASYSCLDDSAWLGPPAIPDPRYWLSEHTAMSMRSLERHFPQLAKLELLVFGDSGFRLPRFYKFHRQNGGENGKLTAKLADPLEPPIRKESLIGTIPPTPLRGDSIRKRDQQKRERVRANFDESPQISPDEFVECFCEFCPVPHYWKLQDIGYVGEVRTLACPDWRKAMVKA